MIAALLGNIVGAQFVGLPFLWFYWRHVSTAFPRQGLPDDVEEGNTPVRGERFGGASSDVSAEKRHEQ